MEVAPNNRNAQDSLIEDLVLEILCHLPARSLFSCKCVYRSWNHLISDNRKLLSQTVAGFFYDKENGSRNFTSVSDCCNSLILCGCLGADGYCYVIYNPMTQNFNILPPSTHDVGHSIGEARLGFDPTTSSHFHVIEYVDVDGMCTGVEIYSSKTAA
ncbi:F-box protein At5g07610-like [Miscanthus floridulus]|uniref:F-box protein At5g07610-like n=1 Tax=Miscanthus floridulus TaxID=154761 RepID=UPI00345B1F19